MAVLVTCWNLLALVLVAGSRGCREPGWFGSSCQYKSRCLESDCDTTYGCYPEDSKCEEGWFGLGCQYHDLMTWNSTLTTYPATNTALVTDHDVHSCLSAPFLILMNISWTSVRLFTWIRIYTPIKANITIEVLDETMSSKQLSCAQVEVGKAVQDVYCSPTLVRAVILSGPAVQNVCSLYVSAGRNVALRQATNQTDDEDDLRQYGSSPLAVDGITSEDYRCNQPQVCSSCSSTSFKNPNPTWQVNFSSSKLVYQFIIYNKNLEKHWPPLQGFKLTAFDVAGAVVFTYQDKEEQPLGVYFIPWTGTLLPVSGVQIQAQPFINYEKKELQAKLSLCEVEIYGDSVCQPGTYGMDCEHNCSSWFRCNWNPSLCRKAGNWSNKDAGAASPVTNKAPCEGSQCDAEGREPDSDVSVHIGVGVGLGLLVICVICLVLGAFACRNSRRKRDSSFHEYDTANVAYYTDQYDVIGTLCIDTPDQSRQGNAQLSPQTSNVMSSGHYEQVDDPVSPYVDLLDGGSPFVDLLDESK